MLLQPAYDKVKNAPSRGALVTDFLLGDTAPLAHLQALDGQVG